LEAGEVPVRDLSTVRWVDQHLKHVMLRLAELIGPATVVAGQRHRPWWRWLNVGMKWHRGAQHIAGLPRRSMCISSG
jgi:hypothetical protein